MGEQHSAHFWVLVLPLIDDGLGEGESAQAQVAVGSSYVQVQGERWDHALQVTLRGPKSAKQELKPASHMKGTIGLLEKKHTISSSVLGLGGGCWKTLPVWESPSPTLHSGLLIGPSELSFRFTSSHFSAKP